MGLYLHRSIFPFWLWYHPGDAVKLRMDSFYRTLTRRYRNCPFTLIMSIINRATTILNSPFGSALPFVLEITSSIIESSSSKKWYVSIRKSCSTFTYSLSFDMDHPLWRDHRFAANWIRYWWWYGAWHGRVGEPTRRRRGPLRILRGSTWTERAGLGTTAWIPQNGRSCTHDWRRHYGRRRVLRQRYDSSHSRLSRCWCNCPGLYRLLLGLRLLLWLRGVRIVYTATATTAAAVATAQQSYGGDWRTREAGRSGRCSIETVKYQQPATALKLW